MANVFEEITKKNVQFETPKGALNILQVWNLPLHSSYDGEMNLNDVYKCIMKKKKSLGDEADNLYCTSKTKRENAKLANMELAIEALKRIAEVREEELERATKEKAKAELKQRLLNLKAEKEDDKLKELSVKEIDEMLKDL